jgi:hypothetical protein
MSKRQVLILAVLGPSKAAKHFFFRIFTEVQEAGARVTPLGALNEFDLAGGLSGRACQGCKLPKLF